MPVRTSMSIPANGPPDTDTVRVSGRAAVYTPQLTQTLSSVDKARSEWSEHRRLVARYLETKAFEVAMGTTIFTNICIMFAEVDAHAHCRHEFADPEEAMNCVSSFYSIANIMFLAIYVVESAFRIYVHRVTFFTSGWNLLDFSVVVLGIVDVLMAAIPGTQQQRTVMRLFRTLRLVRGVRLLAFFPELYRLIQLLYGAISPLFWGFVLIMFMIICWSVIAVDFISTSIENVDFNGEGESCRRNFSTLWNATLFFFQTHVVGDDWGTCIIPVVLAKPWAAVVFAIAVVTIQIGLMNLILSAIVDAASAAREHDHEHRAAMVRIREQRAMEDWRKMCSKLDEDGDGCVSLTELINGYDCEEDFRFYLQGLDINEADLQTIFELMDRDNSGDLSYDELINTFVKATSQDMRIQVMTMQLQMNNIFRLVHQHQEEFHHIRSLLSSSQHSKDLDEEPPSKDQQEPKDSSTSSAPTCAQCGARQGRPPVAENLDKFLAPAMQADELSTPSESFPSRPLPKTKLDRTGSQEVFLSAKSSSDSPAEVLCKAPQLSAFEPAMPVWTNSSSFSRMNKVTQTSYALRPGRAGVSLSRVDEIRALNTRLAKCFEETTRVLARHTTMLEATFDVAATSNQMFIEQKLHPSVGSKHLNI